MKTIVPIALDSGAHTLFTSTLTKGAAKTTGDVHWKHKEFSNLEGKHTSKEFRRYLESYMDFLGKNRHRLQFYVTLDLIFNPKGTWEVYREMKASGLDPLPVIHPGEDIQWLHRYMDETDYIGIGGLGQETSKRIFVPWADKVFKEICGKNKKPKVKTHGFAVTSFDLLLRYPWTTVDSTSAFLQARTGAICIPRIHGRKEFDFLKLYSMPITHGRKDSKWHFRKHESAIGKGIESLFEQIGVTYSDLAQYYMARDYFNLWTFNRLFKEIAKRKEQKCIYYASGNPSAGPSTGSTTLRMLYDSGEAEYLGYLGTYAQLTATERLLESESIRIE